MTDFAVITTKEELLGIDDLPIQEVDVPEWKRRVLMKGMTASERDTYEADLYMLRQKGEYQGMVDFRARLLSKSICDRDGKLLFSSSEVKELGKKSALVLDRLFDIARELNGMRKKDIEKATENLPEGQTVV